MHELVDVVNGIGIYFIAWLVSKLQFTIHNTCSPSNAKQLVLDANHIQECDNVHY
jgi:hypothetical protein